MVSTYQMTQILMVFLWFLLFFTGFEVLGHMAGGLLVPEKYKWSFHRSMCCYIVFFIVVTCLLRLPNSKLEPAARFLLESNLFSLVLLAGLILWGVVASVLMVISNRWTKRIFWIAALKKTNTLIVLNLLSMAAVRYWQKLHYRLPGLYIQKQLSLVCFIVVVLGTAVAIGRDWHRNGYNFLLWHLPYQIVAALIFSNVAFMVFAGYWFGAGVS